MSVPKKRDLKLVCHAFGEPAPAFIWSKDGAEVIPTDDRKSISNEGFASILTIHDVTDADGGEYTCEVVNDHGSARCSAEVTVADVRAHFVASFPEHLEVVERSKISLECELSDEEAVVQWMRYGRVLHESSRIKIEKAGRMRRLAINNATIEDSGIYVCQTSDENARAQCDLTVKGTHFLVSKAISYLKFIMILDASHLHLSI